MEKPVTTMKSAQMQNVMCHCYITVREIHLGKIILIFQKKQKNQNIWVGADAFLVEYLRICKEV